MRASSAAGVGGMPIPGFAGPDPFFGQAVQAAEDVFCRKGHCLLLGLTYNRTSEQDRYLEAFRSRMVDGLMVFCPGDNVTLRRMVEQHHRPVVFVGRVPGFEADILASDIALGTELAVEHLISKGHRRIGLITVSHSLSVAEGRLDGWRRALCRAGLPDDENFHYAGHLTSESGYRAATELLKLPTPPTAIFADDLVLPPELSAQ